MIGRVWGVFLRYLDEHLDHDLPGFDLGGAGRMEAVRLANGQLILSGWTTAARLAVHSDGRHVQAALSGPEGAPRKFSVAIAGGGAVHVVLNSLDGDETRIAVPGLNGLGVGLAKLRIGAGFAGRLLSATPLLWRYARSKDPALRAKIAPALGFGRQSPHHTLARTPFGDGPAPVGAVQKITIILPVYNAFDLVQECLARVVAHTDLPWRLIVVEDCSPDERVRPWLRDWAKAGVQDGLDVQLLENEVNRGFIGSVNRAFGQAIEAGDHVVLLNSDALVPVDWATRLMQPILAHADVATVTPMSNDAEIFTAPVICARHDLEVGVADAMDRVAATLDRNADLVEVPTGVGFCMGMNIDFIRRIPELDTIFGRGYGEEVDWCQKARALGGRHVACPWLFVEHRGGESFGSAEKLRLIQANGEVISQRYPGYDREVQSFLRSDPLSGPRMALGLSWLAETAGTPVPIYLAHSMGGGAEMWLQAQLARDLETTRGAVVLRVGGAQRWQLELHTPYGTMLGESEDFEVITAMLRPVVQRKLVYSCGAGDLDPSELPGALLSLCGAADQLQVLIHDFLPLSPSQTLLDHDNRYRGPVTVDSQDAAHQFLRADGVRVPLADWRAAWGPLMARADEVTVFSENSAEIVGAAYAGAKITVRPHSLITPVPALEAPKASGRVVGVLGSINLHKGAEIVARAAQKSANDAALSFVVIGTLDPAVRKPKALRVHGAYAPGDIAKLARDYGITDWLIPSIWPETFSYSTHECLATGLPVFAFDLGAQGDAVRAAPNGHVVPMGADLVDAVIAAIKANAA